MFLKLWWLWLLCTVISFTIAVVGVMSPLYDMAVISLEQNLTSQQAFTEFVRMMWVSWLGSIGTIVFGLMTIAALLLPLSGSK